MNQLSGILLWICEYKGLYPQINGYITIENVDMDRSFVLLLSELGQYGDFIGTKILL